MTIIELEDALRAAGVETRREGVNLRAKPTRGNSVPAELINGLREHKTALLARIDCRAAIDDSAKQIEVLNESLDSNLETLTARADMRAAEREVDAAYAVPDLQACKLALAKWLVAAKLAYRRRAARGGTRGLSSRAWR